MEYFRIKNWDKYQDRAMAKNGSELPWFRVSTNILDDPKTYNMTATQFMIWIKLLALARQNGNRLPLDVRWISARLRLNVIKRRLDLSFLWVLGLIEAEITPTDERRGEESIYSDASPSAQDVVQPKPMSQKQKDAESVLNHLNQVAHKKFTLKAHQSRIIRALGWGFSVDQLKTVINYKSKDPYFKENPKYMNPETLFRSAAKIDIYLNAQKQTGPSIILGGGE